MTGKLRALSTDDILGSHRAEILALAQQQRASNVRVFGSVARGEARPDSDLDLRVTFAPDYTLWGQIGLKQDVEVLLNCRVEVINDRFVRDEMREAIFRKARPV